MQVARIDLPPYPNGWVAGACSEELAPGDIMARTYFGEELAIFRDQTGTVAVLDAYCPHLGAHLGHGGTVGNGCVRCPFHGWEFSLAGTCVGMPYGGRVPPRQAGASRRGHQGGGRPPLLPPMGG